MAVVALSSFPRFQCTGLLCEHDLVPVLGLPRPPTEIGGTTGTAVTTSSLVREADLLEPGSLLMVTAGEGYAPDKSCPCVTVASEMDYSAGSGRTGGYARDKPSAGDMDASRGGECRAERASVTRPSKSKTVEANRWSPPQAANASVVDNDEVLVEMMDAETGLCLGKRVPVGDLRHSTSFFGRELDSGGNTVKKACIWDSSRVHGIFSPFPPGVAYCTGQTPLVTIPLGAKHEQRTRNMV